LSKSFDKLSANGGLLWLACESASVAADRALTDRLLAA
jgi:hypothetical protein